MNFDGIFTPVITPNLLNLEIDYKGLEVMLGYLLDSKVNGIVIAGTTGEYYAQSISERVNILKFAKQVIKKDLPLVAGVNSMKAEESIYLAKVAKKENYDAIFISSPPYSQPTERENANHALSIDRAVDMPVMLYNFPAKMAVDMGKEYLDIVSKSRNFIAIKEASGSPSKLHLLAREFPQIQISCGMDDQALEFFAWGARSWVCAGSNFAPEIHKALYKTCVIKNDFVLGRQIMMAMLPILDVLENGGKFIQSVKYCLEIMGKPSGPPRLPLRPLNKDEKRKLERVFMTMNQTFNSIRIGESDD